MAWRKLSHAIENVLDVVRGAADPPDQDLLQLLFHSVDRLERTIDDAVSQRASTGVDEADCGVGRVCREVSEPMLPTR